jgi:hypothetical protein
VTISGPTLDGFIAFIRGNMQISTAVLPDDDPVIAMAYEVATDIVSQTLRAASQPIYALAVYNLAGSNVINYATDQPGQTYFADARKLWNIGAFTPGVVNQAADVSTSVVLTVQKAMENITLADLQYLKDPWGRQYLAFAQKVGTVWGLT